MKVQFIFGENELKTQVWAERVQNRVVYRGPVTTVARSGSLAEAVVDAVHDLHEKHGRQLMARLGQVKTGGQS